jgi:hypothetical protein
MQPGTFSVFSVPQCFELYLIGLSGKVRAVKFMWPETHDGFVSSLFVRSGSLIGFGPSGSVASG